MRKSNQTQNQSNANKTYHNIHKVEISCASEEKVIVLCLRIIVVEIPGISLLEHFWYRYEFAVLHVGSADVYPVVIGDLVENKVCVLSRSRSKEELATQSIVRDIGQTMKLAHGGDCARNAPLNHAVTRYGC